jgi:hypothetical protein
MFRTTSIQRRWRPAATKVAIACGVAVACAAGTMVGVAAASAPASVTSARVTPARVAPAAAKPRPIDHQLCYTVSHGRYKIPAAIKLFNQFSPHGFVPKINPVPTVHCNPVVKILPSGKKFPITNPAAHLLCFQMTPAAVQPTPKVIVSNQFGSAELIPSQPNLLCLPSWKSLRGPPNHKLPQPPGLSHFTCYPVREAPGSTGYTPPPVMLKDEFSAKPVAVQVSTIPQELCLPTAKVVGKKVTKIVNHAAHLLCFDVTPTPKKPKVWDQNQFGTSAMAIGQTRWLCVPSKKTIVPPPVDHHLCYVATGKYPIPNGVELFNQFAPGGFRPKIGTVAFHCNPVAKTIIQTGQTFPITNPAAHLLCFHMTAPKQATHEVQVTNQFGTGTLVTGQPNLLCLPTWKSLTGPPNMKAPQPPGLSHFTCYPVKELPGTAGYNPPPILLQDEFAPKPVQVKVGSVPQELCLPTKKVIGTQVSPILNPITHLLCFPVSQTPIMSPVFDQNQFGTEPVTIVRTRWLCLPSTKKVIK